MKNYNRLFTLYKQVDTHPVDLQMIMQCEAGVYVPLEIVLAQFKYALENKREREYKSLRQYLETIFDKQTIDDLEAM